MSKELYGWANYPTRCLFMWIGGIDKILDQGFEDPAVVKTYCMNHLAGHPMNWRRDLLMWCLEQVDWKQLASALDERKMENLRNGK